MSPSCTAIEPAGRLESRARPKPKINRLALVAFVCSLVAFAFLPLGAIASILGFIALKNIPDSERGRGLAKWAIALGAFFFVAFIALVQVVTRT